MIQNALNPDGATPPEETDGDMRPVPRISIQAFCVTPEVADTLGEAAADRRMAKAHVKVHMGGIAAAMEFYASAPTPNLLFIETMESREGALGQLDRLSSVCDAGTKVVLIGHQDDVALYRELLRRGVSDYLVAPFGIFDVIRGISDIFLDPKAGPVGRTIAFVGARGGVGSSTVAHNVGFAMSRTAESEVVIADLDLPFGTAGLDFNQDPPQGIGDVLNAPERIDDVFLDRILSKCADNLNLLAAPALLAQSFNPDEEDFDQIIDVIRGSVPAVVLDVPHQWTPWVRHLLSSVDEVVVTAMPDLASLRNAKNLFDQLKLTRPNDGDPHLILNQVGMPRRPEIRPDDFRKALGVEIIAQIAFDPQLFGTANNNGQMIAEVNGRAPAALQFEEIAAALAGRNATRAKPRRAYLPFLDKLPLLGKKAG